MYKIFSVFFGEFLSNCFNKVSKQCFISIITCFILLIASACSSLETARNTTDIVVANKKTLNIKSLVQAEVQRKRLRKLRCHNPLLNPAAISGAAVHPGLGQPWIEELLRDCPEYAAFIAELVLRRGQAAGVDVQVYPE